jgi:hypothetical protein
VAGPAKQRHESRGAIANENYLAWGIFAAMIFCACASTGSQVQMRLNAPSTVIRKMLCLELMHIKPCWMLRP